MAVIGVVLGVLMLLALLAVIVAGIVWRERREAPVAAQPRWEPRGPWVDVHLTGIVHRLLPGRNVAITQQQHADGGRTFTLMVDGNAAGSVTTRFPLFVGEAEETVAELARGWLQHTDPDWPPPPLPAIYGMSPIEAALPVVQRAMAAKRYAETHARLSSDEAERVASRVLERLRFAALASPPGSIVVHHDAP